MIEFEHSARSKTSNFIRICCTVQIWTSIDEAYMSLLLCPNYFWLGAIIFTVRKNAYIMKSGAILPLIHTGSSTQVSDTRAIWFSWQWLNAIINSSTCRPAHTEHTEHPSQYMNTIFEIQSWLSFHFFQTYSFAPVLCRHRLGDPYLIDGFFLYTVKRDR